MIKKQLLNYLAILRPKHWFKNTVVFIGTLAAAYYYFATPISALLIFKALAATILACSISSINYIINDIVDEKGDAVHPIKKKRVVPGKRVDKRILNVMMIILLISSLSISLFLFGIDQFLALSSLFFAGIVYNIRPIRLKEFPFWDVISESVNNPIRILIGWYAFSQSFTFPPISLLLLFWLLGAAVMTAKRYAELQFFIDNRQKKSLIKYRSSFRIYTPSILFLLVLLYLILSTVLFVMISLKSKPSLLISLPFIIAYLIWFLIVMREKDSFLREPENGFVKKPVFSLTAVFIFLLIVRLILI